MCMYQKYPFCNTSSWYSILITDFIDDQHHIFCRLADMTTSCNSQRKGVTFEDNLPPTLGRGGKKGDIYRLVFTLY